MFRFFRNNRATLLNEGKTKRYIQYALGEILLVMIGILLALQVNNWNQQRQLAEEEQKILAILKDEFQYNKSELQKNIEKATRLKVHADSVVLLFGLNKEERDASDVRRLLLSLAAYSTFDPSNGALTDLLSSGRLKLLRNDSLRGHLSRWFGEVQDVKEDELRLINFGDTHMNPFRLDYMTYSKTSPFPQIQDDLFQHRKFENVVFTMAKSTSYIIENYGILESEIDRILELISREIVLAGN